MIKTENHPEFGSVSFYDAENEPFSVYGVFTENGSYTRMPRCVAEQVNSGVLALHDRSAGGRVRFCTDSEFVVIRAEMGTVDRMAHFSLSGTAGFDLYKKSGRDYTYVNTFVPPYDLETTFERIIHLGNGDEKEILINMPLYSQVKKLFIGVGEGSLVTKAPPYRNDKPAVFYGSSITQGGCASRPGLSYQAILSRKLDLDYINLGFSGSAHGEKAIVEYLAGLPMNFFVLDYDHNARDVQELSDTHYSVYEGVRRTHPDIPILILSRPKYTLTDEEKERLAVIKATFERAKAQGDNNVCLIDGKTLMQQVGDEGTVDNCHPNDAGFMSMAQALLNVMEGLDI